MKILLPTPVLAKHIITSSIEAIPEAIASTYRRKQEETPASFKPELLDYVARLRNPTNVPWYLTKAKARQLSTRVLLTTSRRLLSENNLPRHTNTDDDELIDPPDRTGQRSLSRWLAEWPSRHLSPGDRRRAANANASDPIPRVYKRPGHLLSDRLWTRGKYKDNSNGQRTKR